MSSPKSLSRKVRIIAEIGSNHAGSKTVLMDSILAAKLAGADLVKLQAYHTDHLVSKKRDRRQWDTLKFYELKPAWYVELAKVRNLFFSVFCTDIVSYLERYVKPPCYKIAAPDCCNYKLVDKVRATGKEYFISLPLNEKLRWDYFNDPSTHEGGKKRPNENRLYCIGAYPATSALIYKMREPWSFDGISDHTKSVLVPALAVANGATVIEKHFRLDYVKSTPDAAHSLDQNEFADMVKLVREAERHATNENGEEALMYREESKNLIRAMRGKDGLRPITPAKLQNF